MSMPPGSRKASGSNGATRALTTIVPQKFMLAAVMLVASSLTICGCEQSNTSVASRTALEAAVEALDETPAKPADQPSVESAGPEPAADVLALADDPQEEPVEQHPFSFRTQAPGFEGAVDWINTGGPIEVEDLRGKFVILDFWTYCCINCMHILPELKKLEEAYPKELVVIGVHSAKFENEEDSKNITEAVLRYEIEHPVINDANHAIWNSYQVSSWPSLRVIDPEGNLVAGNSGEITFETLDAFLTQHLPYYRRKGVLDETPLRFDLERYAVESTPLRFPGKVLADEAGNRLFIADSNHNRIVVATLDGSLVDVIGSGAIGADDGAYGAATFNHPQGMYLHKGTLYVADTENHMLRKVDLESKQVATVAGTGVQARGPWPGIDFTKVGPDGNVGLPERFAADPKTTPLNSPWALWIHGDDLYIAMAGPHQIWKMTLDESEIGPYAGNGREDIVDGKLLPPSPYEMNYSSFAQPSGLASDGTWLYVADSEGSSIRAVPFDAGGKVRTVVGTSKLAGGRLFTFGDQDGTGAEVLLQHALGVTYHAGKLYIADTYNNKIKVIDPETTATTTLAGTGEPGTSDEPAMFDEPAGITAAAGKLYVADTNNHLVRVIDLNDGNRVSTLEIKGLNAPERPRSPTASPLAEGETVELPSMAVQAPDGALRLQVDLELPEGYKINPLAPMRYQVDASNGKGPIARENLGKSMAVTEPATSFEIRIPVAAAEGEETLRVALTYFYCQERSAGLCKVGHVNWQVPLSLSPSGSAEPVALSYQVE